MQKKFSPAYTFACLTLALLPAACNKLVDVSGNAAGQLVTAQVFSDSANATAGVLGLYTSSALTQQYPDIYTGMGGDELLPLVVTPLNQSFYPDSLSAGSPNNYGTIIEQIWQAYYGNTAIYLANAAMEQLSVDSGISNTLRNQLIGECKVVRALYYFYLVGLFSDVPYVTSTSTKVNSRLPRTPTATIYSQLEQDLISAAALLLPAYPSEGRLRPNRYTADALLARLHLYRGQWQQAQAICDTILNSGLYALEPNLDNVFLDKSQEAIWQLGSSVSYSPQAPPGYSPFLPSFPGTQPLYSLAPWILNAFDSADQRRQHWVDSAVVPTANGTITYYYAYKYKNNDFSNPNNTTEDLMVFRLAEIYLIRAEARARQGDLAAAIQDINLIRNRAGLAPLPVPPSLEAAMGTILHERQTELFCEWGHRWLDHKRTDSINAVLTREKPQYWAADGHDALYPIPATEISANPALTQNPGY